MLVPFTADMAFEIALDNAKNPDTLSQNTSDKTAFFTSLFRCSLIESSIAIVTAVSHTLGGSPSGIGAASLGPSTKPGRVDLMIQ